jgi:uncharacterized protein (TIGR02391 family)
MPTRCWRWGGLILLELVQKERRPRVALSNIEMPIWNANSPKYPQHSRMPVGRAIAEAWQWLQNEGLLMPDLDQPNGWFCLTRKGARLTSKVDVETYRQGNILPVGLLHPILAEKVRPMFLRGDYDVAVFQAFKEVEVAVRSAAGFSNAVVGVTLMHEAFNPKDGPLTDKNAVGGERVALMELFAGAIGHGKNPPSHREVAIERVSAARLIGLASHLLTQIDAIITPKAAG